MAVTVHLFAAARAAAGTPSTEVEEGTLASIVNALGSHYPDLKLVLGRCSFLVDGTAAHGDYDETFVATGSTIDVLPPFAGG